MSKTTLLSPPPHRAIRPTSKFRVSPIAYSRVLADANERAEAQFVETMAERLGGGVSILPVGRARSGIYLLAKYAIEKTGRRKVLLSPFTIPDVANMIVLAGGAPVFFDFNPDSTLCDVEGLAKLIDGETACVLITHYHVNEGGVADIAALCRSHRAFLFDDCAIAFGGKIDNVPVAAMTDGGIFSFSTMKVLNFFWGGLVATRHNEIAAWISKEIAHWPRLPLNAYAKQATTCIKFDMATRPPLFRHVVFPMLRRRAERNGPSLGWMQRIESKSLDATLTSRPHFAAFAEWNRKLACVDEWITARRKIARLYYSQLADLMPSGPISDAQFDEACFGFFPLQVTPESRDRIAREMILAGFDIGRHHYPNVHRHANFSDAPGKSDNVERLINGQVYLPTHFGVSEEYAILISAKLASLIRAG